MLIFLCFENHQNTFFVHFGIKFHSIVWLSELIPEIFPAAFDMKTVIRNKPMRLSRFFP